MKYLKSYESFINKSFAMTNNQINSGLLVLEKKIVNDFTNNFWRLSLKSSVFTTEEKIYIQSHQVDMLNEAWFGDMINKVWDTAKEKGSKFLNKIKEKFDLIKNNFTEFISGITDFVKKIINGFKKLITPAKDFTSKISEKFKKDVDDAKKKDEESVNNEFKQLLELKNWISDKFVSLFSNKTGESSSKIENNLEDDVDIIEELESEESNESIDILSSFYIKEEYKIGDKVKWINKDGDETEKEIERIEGEYLFFTGKDGDEFKKNIDDLIEKGKDAIKGAKDFFLKWFVGMEETSPPKEGGKAKWWIKLILKIFSMCFNWVEKLIGSLIDLVIQNVLKFVSKVSKILDPSAPGPYNFEVTGVILSGLIALATASVDIFNNLDSLGLDESITRILNIVKPYIKEYVPTLETIEKVLAGILLALAAYEIIETIRDMTKKPTDQPVAQPVAIKPKINLSKS